MRYHSFSNISSEAVFSICGKFRYWLSREWGLESPFGVFLLMNPSNADPLRLDLTTMICTNLAVHWGWRGFGIVNLDPGINSTPKNPASLSTDVLNENDYWINSAHNLADYFVLAVGNNNHSKMIKEIRRLKLSEPFHAIDKKGKGGGYPHPRKFLDINRFPKEPIQLLTPLL